MNKQAAIFAFRSTQSNSIRALRARISPKSKIETLDVNPESFKLGNLDSMLESLDQLCSLETKIDVFLKKLEKQANEQQFGPFQELYLETKDRGEVPMNKYLKGFNWDDFRYPRNLQIKDLVRLIEEKFHTMERNLKQKNQIMIELRQLNEMKNPKETKLDKISNSMLNLKLFEKSKIMNGVDLSSIFVKSEHFQSILVSIPEKEINSFERSHFQDSQFIVPYSYVFLFKEQGYGLVHLTIVCDKFEEIKDIFKKKYNAMTRILSYDEQSAKQLISDDKGINEKLNQAKSVLSVIITECFKEATIMLCHLKILSCFDDASLRFGGQDNFICCLLIYPELNKESLLNLLIKELDEGNGSEIYGTKEQLNDTEDFFPFVFNTFNINIKD